MKDFAHALEIVLHIEGGYVNDPDDRGGATNYGVTQGTYDTWRKAQGLDEAPVSGISSEEVSEIYKQYWDAVNADTLAWPVSLVMFDMAVNHGPLSAKKILQRTLQVTPDGFVGPVTRDAMQFARPDSLANEILWHRVDKYRRISKGNQQKFLRGWLWRVAHLRQEAGLEGEIEQAYTAEQD